MELDSQSVWCSRGHLMHGLKSDTEVATGITESNFIVGPIQIEIDVIIQFLVDCGPYGCTRNGSCK